MGAWDSEIRHTFKEDNCELIDNAVICYSQLSHDPLLYSGYFKAKNSDLYHMAFDKFLILLRTPPLERLIILMNAK